MNLLTYRGNALWAFTLISFSFLFSNGQSIEDALRYSLDDVQGTARHAAMSGAFGALGADLTATSLNPAASAVFNTNALAISGRNTSNSQDLDYFGTTGSSEFSSFRLEQIGGIFIVDNYDISSDWTKFSFGVVYDRMSNFDNDWVASGVNPDTSVGSFFLANAQGKRLDQISAFENESITEAYAAIGSSYGYEYQQAFLGYESFIIDPVVFDDANTSYVLNVNGDSYSQRYVSSTRGYKGKVAFNFATMYKDFLSVGINLNSNFVRYDDFKRLDEVVIGSTGTTNSIDFRETLATTGGGFSVQVGAIAKVTSSLRLGLNYHSPTWFYLTDRTTQSVGTIRIEDGEEVPIVINPLIVNYFPTYRLNTPGSFGASAAYVFGGTALLSFDYNYKDYSQMRYSPGIDDFFAEQNTIISNTFKGASTFRVGGEYRIYQVSLRGGYRFEQSPYKDTEFFGDLEGYSFGLGYNFGGVKLDGAFTQSRRDFQDRLYNVGLTDTVQIRNVISNFIFTLSFAF